MNMQGNPPDEIKAPDSYYWGEFIRRMKLAGFDTLTSWVQAHEDQGFAYKTVHALINGDYHGGAGPKIRAIIAQALKEGLIDSIVKAA
jgi:hypothetical protein